jgi:cation:H+ antiporter
MGISYAILSLILGCVLLTLGANRFVFSSAELAKYFSMPPLVAGVLLVGFGGSFPEIIVSMIAAIHGQSALAIGNAIGSNIVNIGLVLGVSALVAPIAVNKYCMQRDFPILLIVMAIALALMANQTLSRFDGVILVFVLIYYVGYMLYAAKRHAKDLGIDDVRHVESQVVLWKAALWWFIGLALLFVSSELLVSGATVIARYFGLSDLVIGLTVVAIGTSLPEFATTLVAALKNHHDIAMGNVIGSNIFNLLAVLAMPALIHPSRINVTFLVRDFPVMAGFAIACWFFCWWPRKKGYRLGRLPGVILLAGFLLYYYFLF